MSDGQLSFGEGMTPAAAAQGLGSGKKNTQQDSTHDSETSRPDIVKSKENANKIESGMPSAVAGPWQSLMEPLKSNQSSAAALEEAAEGESEDTDNEAVADCEDARQILSVTELNKAIREQLEGEFPLIWLQAEISNFKAHTSGHFYFSLKDQKSQINAVMFRGFNSRLKFRPETGMEVIVRGRVTVYEPRGNYQIFCELMEPVGAGALQQAFEQLKQKLQAEGLFDTAKKRPLPAWPRHIGIVTSPTGAAIRDMLNVLGRRYRGARITVFPTKVQGDEAPAEIIGAILKVPLYPDIDVLIVGRGGGSMEDLWAFNDEGVARAIAACPVPVISAVGHEIDFTIADFVADLRAPTPSAAAELVVKNAAELGENLVSIRRRLSQLIDQLLKSFDERVVFLRKRLVDPQRRLQDLTQRNDELTQRLEASFYQGLKSRRMKLQLLNQRLGRPQERISRQQEKRVFLEKRLFQSMKQFLVGRKNELAQSMAVLDSMSPLRVVQRGYSIVTHNKGLVKSVDQIREKDAIEIQFAKGKATATIGRIESTEPVQISGENLWTSKKS